MSMTKKPRGYALLLAGLLAIIATFGHLALREQRDAQAYPPVYTLIEFNGAPENPPTVPQEFYNTSVLVEAEVEETDITVTGGSVCITDFNVTTLALDFDCTVPITEPGFYFVDLTVTGDGIHEVTLRTCSDDGSIALCQTDRVYEFQIDTIKPVVTMTATTAGGPYTFGTWSNKNVFVHFACADEGSGVLNNNFPSYIGLGTDGTYTVPYFSPDRVCVDRAGNDEALQPADQIVKTDQTNPQCIVLLTTIANAPLAKINRTGTTMAVIRQSSYDRTSGVAAGYPLLLSIQRNGAGLDTGPGGPATGPQYVSGYTIGNPLPQTLTFTGAKGRTWTVDYIVRDNAGNERTCRKVISTR